MIDKGLDGRGLYRSVYCSIWSDPEFKRFTPEEKLVFLNLRTSPLSNIAAIYPFWIEPIQEQVGLDRDVIIRALGTLSNRGWITIEEGIVWIKKGLKFDPQISLRNANHLKAVKKAILALPRLQIVRDFIDFYGIEMAYPMPSRSDLDPISIPSRSDLDPISVPIEISSKEKEKGIGKEERGEGGSERGEEETSPPQPPLPPLSSSFKGKTPKNKIYIPDLALTPEERSQRYQNREAAKHKAERDRELLEKQGLA
jgi:hypothetical protein